jgi:hypothetical protein
MTGRRRKGRPIGETIGGIIVGFDQQIFRTTPPVQELIAKARPVRGTSGEDGSEFEVVFPDDATEPAATAAPDADPADDPARDPES